MTEGLFCVLHIEYIPDIVDPDVIQSSVTPEGQRDHCTADSDSERMFAGHSNLLKVTGT